MNRRRFLKSIGKVGAGLVMAPTVLAIKDNSVELAVPQQNIDSLTRKEVGLHCTIGSDHPELSKIEQLRIAINIAERNRWVLRKILCRPLFFHELKKEIELKRNIQWHCQLCEKTPICLYGYMVIIARNILGDYCLKCERVHAVFYDIAKKN